MCRARQRLDVDVVVFGVRIEFFLRVVRDHRLVAMPIHVALEQVAGPHVLLPIKISAVDATRDRNDISFVDRVLDYRSDAAVRPYYSFQVEDALLGLSVFGSDSDLPRHRLLDERSTSIKLLLPGPLQGVPPASIRGEECQ